MERKAFSVCFDWQGEAGECEAGVRLLLPDLGGQLEDGGICVTVIREPGDTLSVCRDGSSARIIYGGRVQFFRALGLLVQHLEDPAYRVSETCRFRSNGTMFDVSQSNALMTVEHVQFLLRRMALMGLNVLMLYNECNY